jgi:hypothetical protein
MKLRKPLPYGRGSDQSRVRRNPSRDRKGAVAAFPTEALCPL